MFEGQAVAAATRPLRVSLELVWHTAVSCPAPRAASEHDASVIEVELWPHAAGAPPPPPPPPPHHCTRAALLHSQGWHRIERCLSPSSPRAHFSQQHRAACSIRSCRDINAARRYSVTFPVENGAALQCSAAVEFAKN
jgi:hypothetical protein